MPVPVRTATLAEGLSFEDAAALPLAGLTALQTLERAGVGRARTC
jgi:NADPH2:quinone reductase